jgi:hypothetical protein
LLTSPEPEDHTHAHPFLLFIYLFSDSGNAQARLLVSCSMHIALAGDRSEVAREGDDAAAGGWSRVSSHERNYELTCVPLLFPWCRIIGSSAYIRRDGRKLKPEVVRELVEGDLGVGAVDEEAAEVLLHPVDGDPRGPGGGRGAGGPGRGREAQADADADPDPERRHDHALRLHGGLAAPALRPAGGGGGRAAKIGRRGRREGGWNERIGWREAWAAGSVATGGGVVLVAAWRDGRGGGGGGSGAQVSGSGLCSLPLLASRSFAGRCPVCLLRLSAQAGWWCSAMARRHAACVRVCGVANRYTHGISFSFPGCGEAMWHAHAFFRPGPPGIVGIMNRSPGPFSRSIVCL